MLLGLYSVGFVVVFSAATYVVHVLHVPAHWIVICAVVLLGAGVVSCSPADEQPKFPDEDCYR